MMRGNGGHRPKREGTKRKGKTYKGRDRRLWRKDRRKQNYNAVVQKVSKGER